MAMVGVIEGFGVERWGIKWWVVAYGSCGQYERVRGFFFRRNAETYRLQVLGKCFECPSSRRDKL